LWGIHPVSAAPKFIAHANTLLGLFVFVGVIAGGIVLAAVYTYEYSHLMQAVHLMRAAKQSDKHAIKQHVKSAKHD
jgi:uncharacterized membrane protein (DUF485 family)